MKQNFLNLLLFAFLLSCSKNDPNPNCNFLVNAGVDFTVDLNLPQFNSLLFSGNSVLVTNQGNGGVIVTRAGTSLFAWDAADPNHGFSNCSIMSIIGGINAACNCDDGNEYSLVTGQSLNDPLPCTLKMYRVEQTGSSTYLITN